MYPQVPITRKCVCFIDPTVQCGLPNVGRRMADGRGTGLARPLFSSSNCPNYFLRISLSGGLFGRKSFIP